MSTQISRQAKAWLTFFYLNPDVRVNYLSLMNQGLSRRKSLAVLKELRDAKAIIAKKSRYIGTNLELTSKGLELTAMVSSISTTTAVQLVSAISNSYTARTTIKATNKFFDEVKEEEKNMGYGFFEKTSSGDDSDLLRERQKHVAAQKAEYEAGKIRKAEQRRDMHRSKIDPINWTVKDVAYEFADRMANLWNIAPFSVVQSRFVPALAAFRKQQGTDGALELALMEMFFDSIELEKYTDGNHLWRAFLYKAPSMVQAARERTVSQDQIDLGIAKAQELTDRKLALLEDEDV